MTEVFSLDAVGQLFYVVPDLASPPEVQSSLREILDDETVELFWWDWERERYVDVHFRPVEPIEDPGRTLTWIDYDSRKIGAIGHDPKLLEEPSFLAQFVPAMRIAMERDRLHRDLVEKLDQL